MYKFDIILFYMSLDNLSHIHLHSYDAYMQDFSGKNSPSILDNWVFDQVDKLFELQENRTCTDLCERGNIYFLHLLGLDTAGHSFKPTSRSVFLYINFKLIL